MTITIPGDPVAQGRGRAVSTPRGIRVVDPSKSRNWKAVAQHHMAMQFRGQPLSGPLSLMVCAYFACPKSDYRKTPVAERFHAKRPDADNILKCVQDAGNGILWGDDSQIASASIIKRIAAQGAAPRVVIVVGAA